MTIHQLYATRFSSDALERDRPRAQRRQARAGILEQSVGNVETVAAEPGERRLQGTFVGKYSEMMAAELKELIGAGDHIDAVPYFLPDSSREWEGYYAPAESRDADRFDPRLPNAATFDGSISRQGSRESHRRAVRVSPRTVTNPFGSQTERFVYLAEGALNPRWVYLPDGSVESATVQATLATEHVNVQRYDHTEPSFSGQESYRLVYDLPLKKESRHDVRTWDDYCRAKSQSENNGNVTIDPAWQRIYQTQHEFVGNPVLDNGFIRLRIQVGGDDIEAYQWDVTNKRYSQVSLGSSSWQLERWDFIRIGLARVVSRTRWVDTNNPGTTYELIAIMNRGSPDIIFYEPENATGSTPSGLVTLLDGIADDSDTVIDQSNDLIKRDRIPNE